MSQSLQERSLLYARVLADIFNVKGVQGHISRITAGARVVSYWTELENPLQLQSITGLDENIALRCRVDNVISYRQGGYVLFQLQLPQMYWKTFIRGEDVTGLEIGLTDTKKPVSFGFEPPHQLVAAATNEGKSYTVKSMVLGLTEVYTPDEIQIVMCDKHYDYTEFSNSSHFVKFSWGTHAFEYNDILEAIRWVYNQFLHRMTNNIKTDSKIVLIIDEVESMIRNSGGKNSELAKTLLTLTEEARKFQIFVLLTSKKPSQDSLPGIINNLGNRWIGKMNLHPSTTSYVLQQTGIDLNQLIGKGDFFHVGEKGELERFQVAKIPDGAYDKIERGHKSTVQIAEDIKIETSEVSKKGRPKTCINPIQLALYTKKNLSHSQARNLGFTRTNHELHKLAKIGYLFGKAKLEGDNKTALKFYNILKKSEKGKQWIKEINS